MEVPEASIIPSSDDFEEVSIDGTSCAAKAPSSAGAASQQPAFFMCKSCNIYFPEQAMLRRHLNAVHRERKSLLEQLRERVEGYFRDSNGRYACSHCNYVSYAKAKIIQHVTAEHGRKVRSVAVKTPRVTVAIETATVPEFEPKLEPKTEPMLEETQDFDVDQFEIMEEHKVESDTEPDLEMLPDEADQFEEMDEYKIEAEKEEIVDIAEEPEMEPELEQDTDVDIDLTLEPEPELPEESDLPVVITVKPPQTTVKLVQPGMPEGVEIILEPEQIGDVEIIIPDVEEDPIRTDLSTELPAGLEHGEEEMMVVTDDTVELTESMLDEAQIVNEEDLHYVQEVEVTAEEAPAEGNKDPVVNKDSRPSGRWPDTTSNLLPEELFRCKYCDYTACRRPTLYAHIRRKHRQLWLEATGRREDEHPMSQEQLSALGLAKREFPCEYCDYASTTRGTLISHMRNKHPDKELPPVVRKPLLDLRCDMCDFRTRSRRKIEVHIERKHVTEMRYTCEYCGKKFKVKCDLTSHIRFQHFKTPTICDVCGKICSNTNSLHVHQKREHFKPDFECHICGRRVVSQANLDEHIRRQHEERSKFMCEQCGKVFDQPNKLRQHIMTHTGERPHTCPICKKAFARRAVFRQHFLIHTGERPYICDICGKSFTQKPGLICHRKMHPGDKPPLPVVYIDHIIKRFEKGDGEDEE